MSDTLALWLNQQTANHGWTLRQVARKAGVSHTTVIKIANNELNPKPVTCRGLAVAFGVDIEEVYRVAGILPARRVISEPRARYDVGEDDEVRLVQLYRELPEDERGLVMELIERLTGRVVARIVGPEEQEK